MATAGQRDLFLDTSVLVNFLRLNRAELLVSVPGFRALVTDHVYHEVTERTQRACLTRAIDAGHVTVDSIQGLPELTLFSTLTQRLGEGESAAIAAASVRGAAAALDDGRAKKEAVRLCQPGNVLDTASIIIRLIRGRVIDVALADSMKVEWETKHRLRLAFKSFASEV